MDIIKQLRDELGIKQEQVEAAVKLIDEGNTIPFIARYRKEATGSFLSESLRLLPTHLPILKYQALVSVCLRGYTGSWSSRQEEQSTASPLSIYRRIAMPLPC